MLKNMTGINKVYLHTYIPTYLQAYPFCLFICIFVWDFFFFLKEEKLHTYKHIYSKCRLDGGILVFEHSYSCVTACEE